MAKCTFCDGKGYLTTSGKCLDLNGDLTFFERRWRCNICKGTGNIIAKRKEVRCRSYG